MFDDFSLVAGGPLYRIWRRIHLLKPPLGLLIYRIVFLTLLAWLPLVALTLVSGNVLTHVPVPFVYDMDAHIRFLVVLPLLVAAEIFVHQRLRASVCGFVDRGLVVPDEREKFQKIVASTVRLRDSVIAELGMILLIWTLGHWFWMHRATLGLATWYAWREGDAIHYTLAGYWYAFASIPIFQFLLLRWYYRLAIWGRFLWKTSRLKLNLIPTHPDKAGGLGFLIESVYAFLPVLAAHSILFAGVMANQIWHESASLLNFKLEIVGLLILLLAIVFVPLTAFSGRLTRARWAGIGEYGLFSEKYVRRFDSKWIRGEAPAGEPLIGSSDIQSLADLANSYNLILDMQPVPFSKETVFRIALLLALPFVPLILTIVPVDQILYKMVDVIL